LLLSSDIYKKSKRIACYFATDHEFSLQPIIDAIISSNKLCYLPKINNDLLDFVQHTPDCSLVLNRFNILEPNSEDLISKKDLDLVLVPLVGFDLSGNRLGMGGGFYDKSFNFLLNKTSKSPFFMGVGFESQQSKEIPTEDFDVKLDAVMTEAKVYYF